MILVSVNWERDRLYEDSCGNRRIIVRWVFSNFNIDVKTLPIKFWASVLDIQYFSLYLCCFNSFQNLARHQVESQCGVIFFAIGLFEAVVDFAWPKSSTQLLIMGKACYFIRGKLRWSFCKQAFIFFFLRI